MPLAMRFARSSARLFFFLLPPAVVGIHADFGSQLSHYKKTTIIIIIMINLTEYFLCVTYYFKQPCEEVSVFIFIFG